MSTLAIPNLSAGLKTVAGALLLGMMAVAVLLLLPWLPKGHVGVDVEAFLPERGEDAALVLAYFGFPGCTDTCPVALQELAQLRRQLQGAGLAGVVEFAFVNIDPWADRHAMDAWMQDYDQAIRTYMPDEAGLELLERRLGLVLRPVAGRGYSHVDYFVLLRRAPNGDWQAIDRSRRPDPARLQRIATDSARREQRELPAATSSFPSTSSSI